MQVTLSGSMVISGGLMRAPSGGRAEAFEALWWMGGLILGLSVVVVLLAYLRRRLRATARASADSPPFTLDQLRQMRERGDLTDGEYQALRDRIFQGR